MAEHGYCEGSGYDVIANTILQFSGGFGVLMSKVARFSSVILANKRYLRVMASQHYADLVAALLFMQVSGRGDDILCEISLVCYIFLELSSNPINIPKYHKNLYRHLNIWNIFCFYYLAPASIIISHSRCNCKLPLLWDFVS